MCVCVYMYICKNNNAKLLGGSLGLMYRESDLYNEGHRFESQFQLELTMGGVNNVSGYICNHGSLRMGTRRYVL